ncbi:MAG: Gp15 family bacteriophage protein [Streptococcus sp.]
MDLFDMQGKLHWRKFNALLSGLPEGTKLRKLSKYVNGNHRKATLRNTRKRCASFKRTMLYLTTR